MEAILVDDPNALAWDDTADVVVVGYGGAGACAAIEARENGASVIIVERFGGGGTTSYSGGVIYAGGTRYQREAGYDDSAEKMFTYLSMEVGDAVRPETLRRYCEGSAADVEWLVGHGVQYSSSAYEEKALYPPEGKYLYYSGNEKTPEYAQKTPPVPRGHRAVGPGYGGAHYFAALAQAVDKLGVRIRRHEKACRLVLDRSGQVLGLEVLSLSPVQHAEHERLFRKISPHVPLNNKASVKVAEALRRMEAAHSRPLMIRAVGGVVLATGSYAFNLEELRKHSPSLAGHYDVLHRLATLGSDGSGIRLGQSAGGATGYMNSFYTARNVAPPNALLHGIIVNEQGKRFIPEDAYAQRIGQSISQQSNGNAWLVLPTRDLHLAIRQALFGGWHLLKFLGVPALINIFLGGTRRGPTATSVARTCGIDAAGLEATIAAHDAAIAGKGPDAVGKNHHYRAPLGDGPFYAVNMCMANRYAFTYFMTLGGLTVNEDNGLVTRADGTDIPGLYAVGLSAVGLHSNGYISGISLGDGVFSGRRAGRSASQAARQINKQN